MHRHPAHLRTDQRRLLGQRRLLRVSARGRGARYRSARVHARCKHAMCTSSRRHACGRPAPAELVTPAPHPPRLSPSTCPPPPPPHPPPPQLRQCLWDLLRGRPVQGQARRQVVSGRALRRVSPRPRPQATPACVVRMLLRAPRTPHSPRPAAPTPHQPQGRHLRHVVSSARVRSAGLPPARTACLHGARSSGRAARPTRALSTHPLPRPLTARSHSNCGGQTKPETCQAYGFTSNNCNHSGVGGGGTQCGEHSPRAPAPRRACASIGGLRGSGYIAPRRPLGSRPPPAQRELDLSTQTKN